MTHLQQLEAESIGIFRDAFSQSERPLLLYSVGKDSGVLAHIARKAFWPGSVPFPVLHIDSTWKFREMYAFRDRFCKEYGLDLIVRSNEEGRRAGANPFDWGSRKYTDVMKTQALLNALAEYKCDLAFGGARRDEEKSRAKERVFSFRDRRGQWDPKNQRPELWDLYNGKVNPGESVRCFPLSNWTELDVWNYIKQERIPVCDLYFARTREVVERDGMLICPDDERMRFKEGEKTHPEKVRFRTLGCWPLSAAERSEASTIDEIIEETFFSRVSERAGRLIDKDCDASMEQKKREGYF